MKKLTQKIISFFKYYQLPILAGVFIGTSYIPFYPWALFFAYTPLFIFWYREPSLKKVLLGGWLTQFVLNAIGFYWIIFTVKEFGELPYPVAFLVQILFCAIAHLYFPLAGAVWFYLKKRLNLIPSTVFWLPPLFLIIEHFYPSIFQWHMGYTWFWSRFPAYQTAEFIGFVGLYLVTLFFSSASAWFLLNRNINKKSYVALGLSIFVFLTLNILGLIIEKNLPHDFNNLKVLSVQANIGNASKVVMEKGGLTPAIDEILSNYINLSQEGLKKYPDTQLIVWPETAFQGTFLSNKQPYSPAGYRLLDFVKQNKVSLITGTYERGPYPQFPFYNSMMVIDENATPIDFYQKQVLLAFGEYLPGGELFPKMKTWLPQVSDFSRGLESKVVPWHDIKIGMQICYEGLFDYLSQASKLNGANLIVNSTNDSWYDLKFEPNQHMYMTLSRAVEFRLPIVRVTNTGISSAVTSAGKVLELSPQNQTWYHQYDIPVSQTHHETPFTKLLTWKLWILFGMLFSLIGGSFVFTRRN